MDTSRVSSNVATFSVRTHLRMRIAFGSSGSSEPSARANTDGTTHSRRQQLVSSDARHWLRNALANLVFLATAKASETRHGGNYIKSTTSLHYSQAIGRVAATRQVRHIGDSADTASPRRAV